MIGLVSLRIQFHLPLAFPRAEWDEYKYYDVISCMEDARNPADATEDCIASQDVAGVFDFTDIQTCAEVRTYVGQP